MEKTENFLRTMKKVIEPLEIEFFLKEKNKLEAIIREAGSSDWSFWGEIWRNIRDKHINYPKVWFGIVDKLREILEDYETIVELYPSEAGNIRGLIEDEIKLLEDENSNSEIYSKKLSELGYNYQFIFDIKSSSYLKKIIEIYYANYLVNFYLIPQKNKYKFANLLSEYEGSSQDKHFIKEYHEPFCFITTDIDMQIITNCLTIEDIIQAINYKE